MDLGIESLPIRADVDRASSDYRRLKKAQQTVWWEVQDGERGEVWGRVVFEKTLEIFKFEKSINFAWSMYFGLKVRIIVE